jgi:hypothetical protein
MKDGRKGEIQENCRLFEILLFKINIIVNVSCYIKLRSNFLVASKRAAHINEIYV